MLEEDYGVIVADGGFDQPFRVIGSGRADYLQAGVVDEPHFGILRVEWAAVYPAPTRPPQNDRSGRTPEIMGLGHHVADLVHGAGDEIHELEFGDRTHAGERGAESGADYGGFRDRRVDYALGAKTVDEAVGDFEGAAVNADVFAQAEDGGIAFHLFPDSLAYGFEVSELGHRRSAIVHFSNGILGVPICPPVAPSFRAYFLVLRFILAPFPRIFGNDWKFFAN